MTDIDKPLPDDAHDVTLTIRMIMNGKEVGSIIGKGGEIINNIRDESGAKIHITDGSVPERIVTVTGRTDPILRAFTMICRKFEDEGPREGREGSASGMGGSVPRPPITLRLVVPASQCGSLIGKGGSKIKEIREVTGASINVASEMLPQSTERAVTISGTKDAITQCVYHVCIVMLESPPKGSAIPYCPKGGSMGMGSNSRGGRGGHNDNPLASLLGLGGGGASTLAALATLAGSQIRDSRRDNRDHGDRGSGGASQAHEMSIPNELIGCIIGKGGSKIAEIRQISGAMIRISKTEDAADDTERHISISGNSDSVALAKSLINMSLDLHKSKMDNRESSASGNGSRDNSRAGRDRDGRGDNRRYGAGSSDLGLAAQLLAKPEALTSALTTLATFGSLGGLGGGLFGGLGGGDRGGGGGFGHQMGGQVTGAHRSSRSSYGGSGGSRGSRDEDRRDSKRSKFAPY